jgi:uncharacterized coiled-coil protein SlyX
MNERIDDLEVRYAFQEDTIRQLDEVVRQLGDELRALKAEMLELRAQMAETPEGTPNKLEDEKPPHY